MVLRNSPTREQWLSLGPGLDTNGCPLGNSKFTLLSDNLNISLWLSACQVEKIQQNQMKIDTNVYNPINDLDVIYNLIRPITIVLVHFSQQNYFF